MIVFLDLMKALLKLTLINEFWELCSVRAMMVISRLEFWGLFSSVVEHWSRKPGVVSSNLTGGRDFFYSGLFTIGYSFNQKLHTPTRNFHNLHRTLNYKIINGFLSFKLWKFISFCIKNNYLRKLLSSIFETNLLRSKLIFIQSCEDI